VLYTDLLEGGENRLFLGPLENIETGIRIERYFGYSGQKGDLCMIKIYGFLEGPAPTGGWEITATCQCGVCLVRHISTKMEDAQHDIGVTSHEQHELYHDHCTEQHQGEPFQLEWVDHPSNYQGVRQSDVEVINWSEDEVSSLANLLRTTLPADHENSSTLLEDGL
jgi:hypothetical protein